MSFESGETCTSAHPLRPLSLSVTLAVMASAVALESANAGDVSLQRRLAGCWSQTSSYSAHQIPADKNEWGTRTWCFRPRGVLETVQVACGKFGGCDGWEGQFQYRTRGPAVELEDPLHDRWRKCLPIFENNDRFVLTNCEMSQDAFVRAKDRNRTH